MLKNTVLKGISLALAILGSISSYAMTASELESRLAHSETLKDLDGLYSEVLRDTATPYVERKQMMMTIRGSASEILDHKIEHDIEALKDPAALTALHSEIKDLVMNKYRHLFAAKDKYALEESINQRFRSAASERLAVLLPEGAEPEHWHRCQGEHCHFGKVLNEGDSAYFSCVVCGHEACLKCGGLSAHTNCEEYAQDLKSMEDAGVIVKPCPHCKTLVSKEGGCDRMTCLTCGKQWEWSTGKTGKDLSVVHQFVEEQ